MLPGLFAKQPPRPGEISRAPAGDQFIDCLRAQFLPRMGPLVVKSIQLGRDFGDSVEVTAGLAPQDRVIASPPETLQGGDVVQLAAAPPSLPATQAEAAPPSLKAN